MYSAEDTPCGVGCPIRKSRDQRSLASPPGLSQRATSFIASQCQGIHQMPFFLRLISKSSLAGRSPARKQISHEDTLLPKKLTANRLDERRQTLLRILHSSPCQRSQSSAFASRRIHCFSRSISNLRFTQRRLVEVNGIEPSTSCLQSRRSPN